MSGEVYLRLRHLGVQVTGKTLGEYGVDHETGDIPVFYTLIPNRLPILACRPKGPSARYKKGTGRSVGSPQ